jgi:hypothetical protein
VATRSLARTPEAFRSLKRWISSKNVCVWSRNSSRHQMIMNWRRPPKSLRTPWTDPSLPRTSFAGANDSLKISGRLQHLARIEAGEEAAGGYDSCDDATSGLTTGWCSKIGTELEQ